MRRVGRLLAGLGIIAAFLTVLAAMPAVVWIGVGWPLPTSLPRWSDVSTVLSTSGISDTQLLDALSVAFWVLWLDLVLAVVVETGARLRGRAVRRLLIAAPFQALAAEAISLLIISLTSLGSRGGDSPRVTPLFSAALVADVHGASAPLPNAGAHDAQLMNTHPHSTQRTTDYVVQRGDSEWSIAGRKYGDPRRWPAIWEENEGREEPGGRHFTNPSLILPGWHLDLPELEQRAQRAPATPTEHAIPSQPAKQPAAPVTPSMPATPPRSGDVVMASPAPTTPAISPPVKQPTATAAPSTDNAPRTSPAARIRLPLGGAIGLSLAAAIAGAVAIARRHESRRRRVGDTSPSGVDSLIAGPSVRAARRAVIAKETPSEFEASSIARTPRVLHQLFEDMPGRTPLGTPADDRAVEELSLDAADLAGVALTGPGAERAARAIVVGLLGHHPPHRAEVMVVGRAARLLSGVVEIPGVTAVADVGDAAALIDDEFARRSRTLLRRGLHDYRETAGSHDPFDVLVAVVAAEDLAVRPVTLDAALLVGARLGIAVVGVGDLEGFRAVAVAEDGVISAPIGTVAAGDRLHVLSEAESVEFLRVIAASRGVEDVTARSVASDEPSAPSSIIREADAGEVRAVDLRLFGRPQVLADGVEVRSGLRTRARALLVLLGVRAAGVTPEEALTDLWHEAGDMDADNSYFYTVVTNVRRRLRTLLGRHVEVILSAAERFELDTRDVDVDVWRFDSAVAEAARATDIECRTAALERAIEEVRGEPLDGIDYEWAEPVRERVRRRAVDALSELADLRARFGRFDEAIALTERALQLDRASEDLYRRLMVLQQRAGRPEAARRAFHQCQLELEELGVEPDPETRAIADSGSPPVGAWSARATLEEGCRSESAKEVRGA